MNKKELENFDPEKIDELLRQKMIEAADEYEKELNADPSLAGLKPSPKVYENIMAMIAQEEAAQAAAAASAADETAATAASAADETAATAEPVMAATASQKTASAPRLEDLLSEEDRKALELGRKHMAHPVRHRVFRYIGIAAAAMVAIFGASMSIEANREKFVNVINILVAKESVARLNNDSTNMIVGVEERDAKEEIEEKLGIIPIDFMYMPDGMEYDAYVINENFGSAKMFYRYQDTIVYSMMEKRDIGVSDGATRDGEVIETFDVETDFGTVKISEIQGPDEKDYLAELIYNDCSYTIYGILPKEEFIKMIKNIVII